jgi:hypothetical protein
VRVFIYDAGRSTRTGECSISVRHAAKPGLNAPTKVLATTSDEGAPYYIPAYGTVRALVVYVQFPDDNTSDPYWSSGNNVCPKRFAARNESNQVGNDEENVDEEREEEDFIDEGRAFQQNDDAEIF